jgi:hypothetical protein
MLIEHMKTGNNYTSFAAVTSKCIETLHNWEDAHPEFLAAKKEAFCLNQAWWQAKAIEALEDTIEYNEKGKPIYKKSINPTILIFNLKNRFPDQWKDRKELDQKIDQTTVVSMDESSLLLMNDLLKELIKAKNE